MKTVFFSIMLMLNGWICMYGQEEFNGPLPGWANLKTRFGAKGNGKDDDTKAIQQAIDSLTQPLVNYNMGNRAYMVIYLPAGTYNISSTIVLKGKIGVSLIGESPKSTIIRWTGANDKLMLLANGSAYFKVSRFTWDANKHAGIEAIGLHWRDKFSDERSTSSAPVNIEFSDNVFAGNCKYGISGGTIGGEGINQMDSEISIRRCTFNGCTTAGIQIKGYNALDYWIWDCNFVDCQDAINCMYGNYHVYRSYFRGSKYADLHNTNGYYVSARGCYSEGSNIFSHDEGASSNPFKRIFQGNTVSNNYTIPIGYYHLGKLTVLDNIFGNATDTAVHAYIETGTWAPGNSEVLSINNTYAYKKPVNFLNGEHRLYSIKDINGVSPRSPGLVPFMATQDKTPLTITRPVLTVPPGAESKKIQQLIDQTVKLNGKKPIIYFPAGRYMLDAPLVITAGSDLQLIGDGYLNASVLVPAAAFPLNSALLNIAGPSGIVIRDLQLNDFTNTMKGIDGIRFNNVDRLGSTAFIDQLYTNSPRSLHGDGLDYLSIQQTNSFYSDGKLITGGPLRLKGQGTAGLYCFGGQFAGLSTDNNGIAVMKDCWWEGGKRKPLDFSGSGRITIDGAMIAPAGADSTTTINVRQFSGRISLMNLYVQGGINVENRNPALNILVWNTHFYFTLDPLKFVKPDASFKGAFMGITTQCFIQGNKYCDNIFTVADVVKGGVKTEDFFQDMLADDRASIPKIYKSATAGASSIFISRVSIGDCNTAISFKK